MSVYDDIKEERERAARVHGDDMERRSSIDLQRFVILTEEVGEVARVFNEARNNNTFIDHANLRKELIQVAAMAAAWADVIPKEKDDV